MFSIFAAEVALGDILNALNGKLFEGHHTRWNPHILARPQKVDRNVPPRLLRATPLHAPDPSNQLPCLRIRDEFAVSFEVSVDVADVDVWVDERESQALFQRRVRAGMVRKVARKVAQRVGSLLDLGEAR